MSKSQLIVSARIFQSIKQTILRLGAVWKQIVALDVFPTLQAIFTFGPVQFSGFAKGEKLQCSELDATDVVIS